MYGEQPQGIALKGDTLFYVTDNLNGDEERIYVYDLASEQHIGSVLLPDPDGDQSPRGLHCDGTFLYRGANRSGGAASAYPTIFIYALDAILSAAEASRVPGLASWPTPADAQLIIDGPPAGSSIPDVLFRLSHSTDPEVVDYLHAQPEAMALVRYLKEASLPAEDVAKLLELAESLSRPTK